jgi:hypothetical protein
VTVLCVKMNAHFGYQVTAFLNQRYGNYWIGRRGPVPWPLRSPDLTPLDLFLNAV